MQTKWLQRFLFVFLGVMAISGAYIYGIILKANGDNVEHLHTSWLVWQGYIPYKDFFQHHNPLTWYLSAPLVAALIDNESIFAIFNIIGVITLCAMAYFLGKVFILNGNSRFAALFVAAVLISSYSILWSTDYRPDTFMYLSLFCGLYYLFSYQQKKYLYLLVISFLCFFLAFMFTQKVLLNFLVPAGFVLYGIYCKSLKLNDVLYALILPVLLFGLFVSYLYFNDALDIYWRANYLFNTHIPEIFAKHRIIFPPKEYIEFYIFIPLGGISMIYFLYHGNTIETLLSLMFMEETFLRLFYFSAFLHYSILWLILGIILTIMFLDKISINRKLLAFSGCGYLLFMLFYNYNLTYRQEVQKYEYMNGHELAFKVLTPCDYAINGYYSVINLKAKDAGYYAILLGQIDVLGEKVGIAPRDNLNELILAKKPKIVAGDIFWDTYLEERGQKVPAHRIDPQLLETYYEPSGLGNIYILKPQYQKKYCVYNGKTWEFID